jgi:hypothetical protein
MKVRKATEEVDAKQKGSRNQPLAAQCGVRIFALRNSWFVPRSSFAACVVS